MSQELERRMRNDLLQHGWIRKTCTSCLREYFLKRFRDIHDVIEMNADTDSIQWLKGFVIAIINNYDETVFRWPIPDNVSKKEQNRLREERRDDEDTINDLNDALKGMEKDKISLSLKQLYTLQRQLLTHMICDEHCCDCIKSTIQKAQYDSKSDKCVACERGVVQKIPCDKWLKDLLTGVKSRREDWLEDNRYQEMKEDFLNEEFLKDVEIVKDILDLMEEARGEKTILLEGPQLSWLEMILSIESEWNNDCLMRAEDEGEKESAIEELKKIEKYLRIVRACIPPPKQKDKKEWWGK